uniref:Uncharacterized protein n=1 Tax=Panagrolaimus superbus TaxID=310955 RepID=A0A914Y9K7_9BILA
MLRNLFLLTGRAGNKGFAYTFILPEGQEKYAGEVCRAFETADVVPPESLKQMWDTFREQMKSQGIDVHAGGGGYTGSGYKYDSDEDEAVDNERKLRKLVTSIENNEDEEDIDTVLGSLIKTKRRAEINPGASKAANAEVDAKVAAARAVADKLGLSAATPAAGDVDANGLSQTATSVMKGEAAAPCKIK